VAFHLIHRMNNQQLGEAKEQVKDAVRKAGPWVERFARFGFVAKGVVYACLGLLILRAAIEYRKEITDPYEVLTTLGHQPFGEILLGLIAIGLFGYSTWRIVETVFDPERKGNGFRGIILRAAYTASAIGYGALGLASFQLAVGEAIGKSDSAEGWTAEILSYEKGEYVVVLLALIVFGVGIAQLYQSLTAKFCDNLKLHRFSATERDWTVRIGRIGFAARAVVFAVIGVLLLRAAWSHNAQQAGGIADALFELGRNTYGLFILAGIGIGFAAYAFHLLIEAGCRKFFLHQI